MLFYRIEAPTSGCKYVFGKGILSRDAMAMAKNNPRRLGLDVPARTDIKDPTKARREDLFIRHLYGDLVSTPFISVTSDFYRALSIASQHLRKVVDYKKIRIMVITSEGLSTPVIDAYNYIRQIPQATQHSFGRSFSQFRNAIRMNHEFLVISVIPLGAIRARLDINVLVDYLPPWLLDADRRFIIPANLRSVHRSWIKVTKNRYRSGKLSPSKRRKAAVRLAAKFDLDQYETKELIEVIEAGPRVLCDVIVR